MRSQTILLLFLSFPVFSSAQTRSIGSKDTLSLGKNLFSSQYTTPLYAKNTDFFYGDSIKGKNQYAAVHTYLVKDLNGDGFSDLFLSFFTGGEYERIPFKLFFYDPINGKMVERSDLIKNNIGQSFNRKSIAADLNGDQIPDIICVSHPECNTCEFSSFDILFSDAVTKTWSQKTLKVADRFKGEGYFHGVATGDIDNDGDNDILLSNENTFTGGTQTLINNGKGDFTWMNSFSLFDPCCFKSGVSWTNELVDMNKDGFLDLLYWHDSTYRGIAYGDGSGFFGRKLEQRFPKSNFTLTMDYDPFDLDKDGDLDLILTVTDYSSGWELTFLENKGLDQENKVLWIDRSKEINDVLRANGFYSTEETAPWVPYIHLSDMNNDGFIDIIPQRPLSNGENPWILYGVSAWKFSYIPLNIIETPTKPVCKKKDHETTQLSWPKNRMLHPRSSKRIKSWLIYYSDKYFGDRSMVSDKPISVSLSNFVPAKDSILYEYKFPYPKTFIRISAIDSSGFETPLSDIDSVFCSAPPKPTIIWNGSELSVSPDYTGYQWYLNNSLISGALTNTYKPLSSGQYKVSVKNVSGCVDVSLDFNLIVTGISPINRSKDDIVVFPNPATNVINIDLGPGFESRKRVVQLFSINGSLLKKWEINQRVSILDVAEIPLGTYIISVNDAKYHSMRILLK